MPHLSCVVGISPLSVRTPLAPPRSGPQTGLTAGLTACLTALSSVYPVYQGLEAELGAQVAEVVEPHRLGGLQTAGGWTERTFFKGNPR